MSNLEETAKGLEPVIPVAAVQALRERLTHQLARSAMGYTDLFEDSAERFSRKTGMLAPGKSVPLEMSTELDEARRHEAWALWQDELKRQWQDDLRLVLTLLASVIPEEEQQQED